MSFSRNSKTNAPPSLTSYIFGERLGRGTYATVYKAHRKAPPREPVAIKCIAKKSLSKISIDNLLTEISICKKVKHQFIVELIDFQWDNNYIYLIFEYCAGGELSRYIKMNKGLLESTAQHFLQQIAMGLKVLRSHNIAHMDLKPQNILISSPPIKSCKNIILKIADFGFAQYMRSDDSATSLRGTPLYMAPEILLNNRYDARVDLWSVGIILYECLFGKPPYSSETFEELAEKIKNPQSIIIPESVDLSPNCRDLLQKLLQRDPDKRISFDDFFDHPFVDLEHMPSIESYSTGVEFIKQAVEQDSKGNYEESLNLYARGLQYLVPVYYWGDGVTPYDEKKQEALRLKLIEYINRAEDIKKKCNLTFLDDFDIKNIQKACHLIENADKFVMENDLKKALECYNLAFDSIMPIISKVNGKRKVEFCSIVNDWMTKAENIKKQLKTCDKNNKSKNNKKQTYNSNNRYDNKRVRSRIDAISFDKFVTKTFIGNESFKPTCYVQ